MDLKKTNTIKGIQKIWKELQLKGSILKIKHSVAASREYCKKDGKYIEHGTVPSQGSRNDLHDVMGDLKENPGMAQLDLMERHPSVFARYTRFVFQYKLLVQQHDILSWTTPPNLWVWGPPGTGKSRMFQQENPYRKMCNKWWDGYDGQQDVLIEDVDLDHKRMGHHLKIWADRYPFTAELKGFSCTIRPGRIIVTSNHHPNEIWSNVSDCAAIVRRFEIINKI